MQDRPFDQDTRRRTIFDSGVERAKGGVIVAFFPPKQGGLGQQIDACQLIHTRQLRCFLQFVRSSAERTHFR